MRCDQCVDEPEIISFEATATAHECSSKTSGCLSVAQESFLVTWRAPARHQRDLAGNSDCSLVCTSLVHSPSNARLFRSAEYCGIVDTPALNPHHRRCRQSRSEPRCSDAMRCENGISESELSKLPAACRDDVQREKSVRDEPATVRRLRCDRLLACRLLVGRIVRAVNRSERRQRRFGSTARRSDPPVSHLPADPPAHSSGSSSRQTGRSRASAACGAQSGARALVMERRSCLLLEQISPLYRG